MNSNIDWPEALSWTVSTALVLDKATQSEPPYNSIQNKWHMWLKQRTGLGKAFLYFIRVAKILPALVLSLCNNRGNSLRYTPRKDKSFLSRQYKTNCREKKRMLTPFVLVIGSRRLHFSPLVLLLWKCRTALLFKTL